jgi:apolipoprotein D and lipocalin family protein
MLQKQLKRLELEINDSAARVRLHDTRLRHSLHTLKDEAVHGVGRKIAIGGAVLAAGWLLGRGLRKKARHAEPVFDDGVRRPRGGIPPWANMLVPYLMPLLTPLINPKVAHSLAALGVPIRPQALEPLQTVEALDLGRYAGTWYEIARLPTRHEKACASDVVAEYTVDEHGGLVVRNRCRHADGEIDEVQGQGRLPDPRQPGQLEVAFAPAWLRWWPGSWADYWVMSVDADYQVALVGTPDRDGLWLLSRQPQIAAPVWEALTSLAQSEGFDTSRLQRTLHGAAEVQLRSCE